MIVLQRYAPANDTDRDWTNHTFEKLLDRLKIHFPQHKIIAFSSLRVSLLGYCLACDIVQYSTADILIGAHGAGLTNAVPSTTGLGLVVILGIYVTLTHNTNQALGLTLIPLVRS